MNHYAIEEQWNRKKLFEKLVPQTSFQMKNKVKDYFIDCQIMK